MPEKSEKVSSGKPRCEKQSLTEKRQEELSHKPDTAEERILDLVKQS